MLEWASDIVPQMDIGTEVYKFGCDWPSELECWSETPQCNPRSDGVLWMISSEYGLKHLMNDVVNSTGVDMHEAT